MTVELYLGDCMEIMQELEDGSVDAVVADPPFGIGFKYESHDDSPNGYGKWIWNIAEICEKKCKPGSPVFIWQATPNLRYFTEWFPRDYRLFIAAKNWVQMRKTVMQYSYDPVVVWWTDGEAWSDKSLTRDYHVANTSPSSHKGLNDVKGHPCPRPLEQVRHIVEQWVRPGGIVLDPFMGSGTTGVACVQTGRNFIGIEIEPKYFDVAEKRITEAQLQMRMEI